MENRIKELRLMRELTQGALGDRAATTAATIQRLESGMRKLTLDWIERIAIGLECDPLEIIRSAKAVPVIGYVEPTGAIQWKSPAEMPEYAPAPPGIDPSRAAAIGPAPGRSVIFLSGYYYFTRGHDQEVERCVNRLSVVQLADQRSFLNFVMVSAQPGKWTIQGLISPPLNGVEIEWAAPVEWIRPASIVE